MANHKLFLDADIEEDFKLIGIHSTAEDYKLAFLLNLHLETKFKRRREDLDFSTEDLLINFPIFEFYNPSTYYDMYLVANKSRSIETNPIVSDGLFSETSSDRIKTSYLLSEFKKVDYFIKIQSDLEDVPVPKIIFEINKIKQIISAYEIDIEKIKSINNLIFE